MENAYKTLATAQTKERLTKLISDYYFGSTITLQGNDIYNLKGIIENTRVIEKKNKFHFQQLNNLTI